MANRFSSIVIAHEQTESGDLKFALVTLDGFYLFYIIFYGEVTWGLFACSGPSYRESLAQFKLKHEMHTELRTFVELKKIQSKALLDYDWWNLCLTFK